MDALAVAFVGGLVGGTVAAVIGGLVTLQSQSRQHAFERAMARESRDQERRQRAYLKIMVYAYRVRAVVDRIAPVLGPVPEPPAALPDEILFRLNALVAAYASKRVRETVLGLSDEARSFLRYAEWYESEKLALGGADLREPSEKMEAARSAVRAAVQQLGEQVNAELRAAEAGEITPG